MYFRRRDYQWIGCTEVNDAKTFSNVALTSFHNPNDKMIK